MESKDCYPVSRSTRKKCTKLEMTYSRPHPDVLETLLRSKANPNYKARKLWYELNMPECTSKIFDGKMLSTNLPENLLCHTPDIKGKRKSKPKEMSVKKNYLQMRAEREAFRKTLVGLIAGTDEDKTDTDSHAAAAAAAFPNKAESEELRYYYYIKYGIDTTHVSPITERTLNRIKSLIPPKLNKWSEELIENFNEIKSDYIYAMKKAVVDFVLRDCKPEFLREDERPPSAERMDIKALTNRYRYR